MAWHRVILFMCISSTPDDAPEPQRLEPVGVQGREVDDRVCPDGDADERGAHSLITPAVRGALLLVLERLGDGGLGERVLLVRDLDGKCLVLVEERPRQSRSEQRPFCLEQRLSRRV